jgi:hypothetical protein
MQLLQFYFMKTLEISSLENIQGGGGTTCCNNCDLLGTLGLVGILLLGLTTGGCGCTTLTVGVAVGVTL